MSTATLQPGAGVSLAGPQPTQWIISKRQDLIWFIGSAVISYLALGLMTLGVGVALIQFIWFFGVDGPHVQSTITRTYFDKAERARLGWFLWIPVPLLLLGPLIVFAGFGSFFFLFAVCWQQFHIVKQHFGFMMLYKGKNKDRTDFLLDRWLLLSSLLIPLGMFVLRTRPVIIQTVPLAAWLPTVAISLYAILAAGWLLRQVQKLRAGLPMNWPKLALLGDYHPVAMDRTVVCIALWSQWNRARGNRAGAVPQLPISPLDVVPQPQSLHGTGSGRTPRTGGASGR